jgi:hypothetical protein
VLALEGALLDGAVGVAGEEIDAPAVLAGTELGAGAPSPQAAIMNPRAAATIEGWTRRGTCFTALLFLRNKLLD